jgi:transcription elongation factor GreA
MLSGATDRGSRLEILQAIVGNDPDGWPMVWADWILHEDAPQLLHHMTHQLEAEGYSDLVDRAMDEVFRNHASHPTQFVWACEEMTEDDCAQSVKARMTPSLLEKLPDVLTRKEFSSVRGRGKALLDGGKVAINLLMESASAQQAHRFSQRIARLDSVEPQRARLVEQAANHRRPEPAVDDHPMMVASKGAVETKQEELRILLKVEIPKTLKGINAAAAEGDLRENFEYHMLRDRQELLSARAAKLQEDLATVRVLEPGSADTSVVNIGTMVHFEGDGETELPPITILGPWDSDLDRRILASGSELAQRLLGLAVGDEVEIDNSTATISRIEAWDGS